MQRHVLLSFYDLLVLGLAGALVAAVIMIWVLVHLTQSAGQSIITDKPNTGGCLSCLLVIGAALVVGTCLAVWW